MLGRYLRIPLLLVQILQYVLCILNKRNNTILRQIISFEEKSKNTTKQNKKSNIKILARSGNRTWELSLPVGCIPTGPPSQLQVSIVVKLFYYFNATGGNVNKQSQNCGSHLFNKIIFSRNILTCMDNYIEDTC